MNGMMKYSALALAATLATAAPQQDRKSTPTNRVRVSERPKPKPKDRRDMSPAELRAVRAAEAKRERRRLRNARIEAELGNWPEGVWKRGDSWMATCDRCDRDYELPCEVGEFNPDVNLCGGSYRCCP